ncbi:MAG: hypothetical protein N3A54_06395 [Patescibacteria group bacterium]|nr:hypothetical protein [Patescibacteria group bacterium]
MPTIFETQSIAHPTNNHGTKTHASSHSHESHHHHHHHDDQKQRCDKMTLFTAYAENPRGVTFETQHEGERVVIFMRPHFITNLPWIFAVILMVLAPFGIIPFMVTLSGLPPIPAKYYVVGVAFWYLATFGYALMNFILWYYNLYIVTTERVIDIDFLQLLYKRFSEARLSNIEDVTFASGGFFAAIFNYGDVMIQTAGQTANFEFHYIPKPASVVRIIGRLVREAHGQKS